MKSSLHPQDAERLYHNRRRGHAPQISISDESHHVTEAIGDMYGDYGEWNSSPRPNSYVESKQEQEYERRSPYSPTSSASRDPSAGRSSSTERYAPPENGSINDLEAKRKRTSSLGSTGDSNSVSELSRSPSTDVAAQRFPLNDIDSRSSPALVAQEISNLQAIRRMSMNVDTTDPDLPAYGGGFVVPSAPPSPSSGEDDASHLFWVPARLHPELSPRDYKSFVEDRVDRIRRSASGEEAEVDQDGLKRRSTSSINRRRSMLHKTIEDAHNYTDGAELLERKRSSGRQQPLLAETTLEELESLVSDPESMMQKLSLESGRASLESTGEPGENGDMPMLPLAPAQSLKRSTRTNYRRGSLNKGERKPFSKRMQSRRQERSDRPETPKSPTQDEDPSHESGSNDLARAYTNHEARASQENDDDDDDQLTSLDDTAAGLSQAQQARPTETYHSSTPSDTYNEQTLAHKPHPKSFQSRIASNGRTTAQLPGLHEAQAAQKSPPSSSHSMHPERKSSQDYARSQQYLNGQARVQVRQGVVRQKTPTHTLDDMANNPAAMLGTDTNTDALSFIPTFTEETKPLEEKKKSKKEKDSGSKSSWSWLRGGDSKDKEKDRDEKEAKKAKKQSKSEKPEKSGKNDTRLDILQTNSTQEIPRGRESLVLDRESLNFEDEGKKSSKRGSTVDGGKKEPGLFSSLFGGKKKLEPLAKKKDISRGHTPDRAYRVLRPDIDYNWTRFSIMEERAIYRMAHIKLANPRRALYSQVLLSNFMYSYLAKVQQMHLIPAFIQEKVVGIPREEQQQQQHQKQQSQSSSQTPAEEYVQWQRYQEQQQQEQTQQQPPANLQPAGPLIDRATNAPRSSQDYDDEDEDDQGGYDGNQRYQPQQQQWEHHNQQPQYHQDSYHHHHQQQQTGYVGAHDRHNDRSGNTDMW